MIGLEGLPAPLARRVHETCERFEAHWQSGKSPRIEDCLAVSSEVERAALLRELVMLDAECRQATGEKVRLQDYRSRFPELDPTWLAAVLGSNAETTRDTSSLRCPNCRQPVHATTPDAVGGKDNFQCSACGSSFHIRELDVNTTLRVSQSLGKFQLLERLGAGAFGIVWKSLDTELDRLVAVKVPHPGLIDTPEDRERFLREARAAARLRHRHIVAVHEVAAFEGRPAIVSDFIDGVSLKEFLAKRLLTFHETATVIAEMAEALAYAHNLGLVHRDLKPANILLESGDRKQLGRAVLADFGLARRDGADLTLTLDGQIVGTPAYMSPEQAFGYSHEVDGRSDVYGLGVVLYELICGELPFRGAKAMLLHQVRWEEPRPPRKINDKIPRDLETICLKAMAKDPIKRYQTAEALAQDLRYWLKGEPIRARAISAPERALRWCRRNPGTSLLIAIAVGLLVAVAVSTSWAALKAQEARKAAEEKAIAEEIAKDKLEQQLYFAHIRLADDELESGNLARAEQLLEDCPSRWRGWEWVCLSRRLSENARGRPAGARIFEGPAPLGGSTVVFNPDSRFLGTYGNGTVVFWDLKTAERRVFKNHKAGLALSNTGLFAFHGDGGTIKICSGVNGSEVRTILTQSKGNGRVFFSPDGRRLAAIFQGADPSEDRLARIWDVATGKEVAVCRGHSNSLSWLTFSPDGCQLATSSSDGTVKVWETLTGAEVYSLPHRTGVQAVVIHPQDNNRLASLELGGTVRVWDLRTQHEILSFCSEQRVTGKDGLAYSPDGRRLALGSFNKAVKLWDAMTGQEVLTLRGASDVTFIPAFSPDGRWLAAGTNDGKVAVWDAGAVEKGNGNAIDFVGHTASVLMVAFTPRGDLVASAGADQGIIIWNTTTGEKAATLEGHKGGILGGTAFSNDGRLLVSTGLNDQKLKIWDVATRTCLKTAEGDYDGVAFNPADDSYLAVTKGSQVEIWDAKANWQSHSALLHPSCRHLRTVAFTLDGRHLAFGGDGREVKVWDSREKTWAPSLYLDNRTTSVFELAWSSDATKLAAFCSNQRVVIWDRENGKIVHAMSGRKMAFSPDGFLAVPDHNRVVILKTKTLEKVAELCDHVGDVYAVAFSPDGKHLASVGGYTGKGEAKIWNRRSWETPQQKKTIHNPIITN